MPYEVTEAAIGAVGKEGGSDWKLSPEEHAANLPPVADALKRVLARTNIREIVRRFRDADTRAVASQNAYRKAGKVGIWSRLAALSIGAFALVMGAHWLSIEEKTGLAILQGLALLTSYLSSLWVSRRGPFLDWMRSRGEAELARVAYFDAVNDADEPALVGELPLLPLQLEYFRRYQLDVQSAYFKGRGRQHARDARRASVYRYGFVVVIGLAALALFYSFGTGEWLGEWDDALWQRGFIAVMTIASAIHAAFSDLSLMELNERNAARYAATAAKLTEFEREPLSEARAAAARGDKPAVQDFCARVQDELSAEHKAWTVLREVAPRPAAA